MSSLQFLSVVFEWCCVCFTPGDHGNHNSGFTVAHGSVAHHAPKSALTKAITMCDSPTLNRRALAAVDDAMTAAMALDGLLYQRINEAVTAEVISTVDKIVEQEIHPHVQDTINEIFISYRDCVIIKRTTAEAYLAMSFLKT